MTKDDSDKIPADPGCSKFSTASFHFNRKDRNMSKAEMMHVVEVDLGLAAVPWCSKLLPGSFDFNKKDGNRSSNKNDSKAKTDAFQKSQDALGATDWDPSQETNQSSSPSEFMFHPNPWLAQTVTSAALIQTLHHGNHNLLVIADEYKVQGFNFYSHLQLFFCQELC